MSSPLNELQIKLAYKFENIQLLHEALTHDFDSRNTEWDILGDGNVFYPKRKLHRLKCVGVSVLKLLITEKAIIIQHENGKDNNLSDEGQLTQIREEFNKKLNLSLVGQRLGLWKFVDTRDKSFPHSTIIKEVVQAIFGAVFIDAGGCESDNFYAIHSVRKLLDLILNKYRAYSNAYPDSQNLYNCFKVRHADYLNAFADFMNFNSGTKLHKNLEKKIRYPFVTPDLLKVALTHDSIKTVIPDVSHYEILEFLGDAVYELVICEYLFWHYINDRDGKVFNFETLKRFVSNEFQKVIANGLKLQQFIIQPGDVIVNDTEDFLESIIGAIYIDAKCLKPVKKVLIKLCRQFDDETEEKCNIRIPITRKTYYGSMHYREIEKLESVENEDELPPKKQDSFKIVSFEKLKSQLGNFYKSNQISGSIHSCNSAAIIGGSESWCNQQEFQRVSLFQTMTRIEYLEQTTGRKLNKNKYDYTYMKYVFRSPDRTFPFQLNYVPECRRDSSYKIVEPTITDVCYSVYIITLYMFNWVKYFASGSKKLAYKFVVLVIHLMVKLFAVGLFIMIFTDINWPLRIVFLILSVCVCGLYDKYIFDETMFIT